MTALLSPQSTSRFSCSWRVHTLTRRFGHADVQEAGDVVHVSVADAVHRWAADGTRLSSLDVTQAWLRSDGSLLVRSQAAPPALLVTAGGARLLPAAPAAECEADVADGDLLLMCSAEALGYLPTGLGGILACSPLRVGAHDPSALLRMLMQASPHGAALLARCVVGPAGGVC